MGVRLLAALLVVLAAAGTAAGSAAVRATPSADVVTAEIEGPLLITESGTSLGTVHLAQPGTYAVWAKASFRGFWDWQHVTCTLTAGSNDDQGKSDLREKNALDTISLHVVHTFTASGTATLSCRTSGAELQVTFARVTALRVAQATVSQTAAVDAGGATPADAVSTYRDGPVTIGGGTVTLATLRLPAGNYLFLAKAYFNGAATFPKPGSDQAVTCRLATARRLQYDYENDESAVQLIGGRPETLVLNVVHPFKDTDTIYFSCWRMYDGSTTAKFVKLTALRVGTVLINARQYTAPAETGASAPAKVYTTYADGPVHVAPGPALTTLAKLQIAKAGTYLIWAKAYLKATDSNQRTTCFLKAGAADDESKVWLDKGKQLTDALATHVVATFTQAGPATLSCRVVTGTGKVDAYWAKATAIKLGALTNTPYPG